MSDGTPTSVTVSAPGSDGAATYTSTRQATLRYGFEERRISPAVTELQHQVASYGRTMGGEAATEAFFAFDAFGSIDVTGRYGLCFYDPAPAPALLEPFAYIPGCPLGGDELIFTGVNSRVAGLSTLGENAVVGRGGYFTVIGLHTRSMGFTHELDISDWADRPE